MDYPYKRRTYTLFQFHKVRLKGKSNSAALTFAWVFQFHKVRLKDKVPFEKVFKNEISIP